MEKLKTMVALWQVLVMGTVLPSNLYGKIGVLWKKPKN